MVDLVATRRLRIVKYRGSRHGTNEYPFLVGDRGISIVPVTSLFVWEGRIHDEREVLMIVKTTAQAAPASVGTSRRVASADRTGSMADRM